MAADQQEQVSVRLLNRPFEPVSLAVRLSDDEHLTASPTLLQFDADNWDQPQWVTVQARNTLRSEQVTAWLQFGPSASNDMGYHDPMDT